LKEKRDLLQKKIKDIEEKRANFLDTLQSVSKMLKKESIEGKNSKEIEMLIGCLTHSRSGLRWRLEEISHSTPELRLARLCGEHDHGYLSQERVEQEAVRILRKWKRKLEGDTRLRSLDQSMAIKDEIQFCKEAGPVAYDYLIAQYKNCLETISK
jgi:hypothetical protein